MAQMDDVLAAVEAEADWCAEDGALTRMERQEHENARARWKGEAPGVVLETNRQQASRKLKAALARMPKTRTRR